MTCFHINQITQKINDFTSKFGDHDSSIYKKLDSIVKEEDIGARLEVIEKGVFSPNDHKAIATYNTYDFSYISEKVLTEFFNEIGNLINDCDCYEGKSSKQKETKVEMRKVEEKADGLQKKFDDSERQVEYNNKEIEKLADRVKKLKVKKDTSESENKSLQGKLAQMAKEIDFLRRELAQSKIHSIDQELETIIKQSEIDRKYKQKICRTYKELIRSQKSCDQARIDDAEEKIEEIKGELVEANLRGENIEKFCKKCNEMAELRVKLELAQELSASILDKS